MRYIKPKRLKILMALFFGTAGWGIIYGLYGPWRLVWLCTFNSRAKVTGQTKGIML